MGGKQNNHQSWKETGKGMTQVGEETKQAWDKLKADSEGRGDIFGDDMVGGLIGAGYQAIFEAADETFSSAANNYEGFGKAMEDVGFMHEENQKANLELIKKIEGGGK